jgi:hypothetical protein
MDDLGDKNNVYNEGAINNDNMIRTGRSPLFLLTSHYLAPPPFPTGCKGKLYTRVQQFKQLDSPMPFMVAKFISKTHFKNMFSISLIAEIVFYKCGLESHFTSISGL